MQTQRRERSDVTNFAGGFVTVLGAPLVSLFGWLDRAADRGTLLVGTLTTSAIVVGGLTALWAGDNGEAGVREVGGALLAGGVVGGLFLLQSELTDRRQEARSREALELQLERDDLLTTAATMRQERLGTWRRLADELEQIRSDVDRLRTQQLRVELNPSNEIGDQARQDLARDGRQLARRIDGVPTTLAMRLEDEPIIESMDRFTKLLTGYTTSITDEPLPAADEPFSALMSEIENAYRRELFAPLV